MTLIFALGSLVNGAGVGPVEAVCRLGQVSQLRGHQLDVGITSNDMIRAQGQDVAHWGVVGTVWGDGAVAGAIASFNKDVRLPRSETVLLGLHDLQ